LKSQIPLIDWFVLFGFLDMFQSYLDAGGYDLSYPIPFICLSAFILYHTLYYDVDRLKEL
jgi:hypothetical protein